MDLGMGIEAIPVFQSILVKLKLKIHGGISHTKQQVEYHSWF